MRLAAVCAIYGDFDLIPPVPDGVEDAVLVTDRPVRSGWRNVVEPSELAPRMSAKRPKCRPDLYTECEASLWMDGSLHLLDDRFIRLVREKLEHHEIVVWDHPEDRDCIQQEALHCHDWTKYRDEPILRQADHYRASGMPEHFGLYALGSIARHHTTRMRSLGDAWMDEMREWTIQDQISLPYLFWKGGIQPGTFEIDQYDNDMLVWMPHAAELRRYRETVLGLESALIHANGRAEHFEALLRQERAEKERLLRRRSVRVALGLAELAKPLFRRGRA